MKLLLGFVSPRSTKSKNEAVDRLVGEYIGRADRLCPTVAQRFDSEDSFLEVAERQPGRAAAHLLLLEPRGDMLSSEELARYVGRLRDDGVQRVVFGIGPADGWSETAWGRAQRKISLGPMTLPHELARVVLAEQVYRALTILAGHPYHCGH